MGRVFSILILSTFVGIFALSHSALADSAQLVSGPTGTMVNGWYTMPPTVTVQDFCNGSPSGGQATFDITGWEWTGNGPTPEQAEPGKHYIELLSDGNSQVYIDNDGSLWQASQPGGAPCGNPEGTPSTILRQDYIQWDESSPTVSITSPSDNTNTAASTIQLAGTAGGVASGIQSVTVNGAHATVSGSAWSVDVPLTIGLNSFTATATSVAGFQTTTPSITVFRYENPASANSGTTSNTTGATANSTSKSVDGTADTASPNNANTSTSQTNQKTTSKPSGVSTPVKVAASAGGVGAAGLATASYLGYVPYRRIGLLLAKLLSK